MSPYLAEGSKGQVMIGSRRLFAPMLFVATLLVWATGVLQAGQETVVPLRYLVQRAHLIAEVNVTNVTRVDVPTAKGQLTSVYVAEAAIVQTIKPVREPTPANRKLAIVASTLPRTSAVFRPIQQGRYLAFLQVEQGHYHYGMNLAFRPVEADGNVDWYEYKDGRPADFSKTPLKKAIERIQEVQRELAAQGEVSAHGAVGGAVRAPTGAPKSSLAKADELPTKQQGEADVYQKFNAFCRRHFGAEKEPLVYQKYGNELVFAKDGTWSHVSENSAAFAWETNLPAVSYIEYGPTEKYGQATIKDERPFCLHVHYLTDLIAGQTYHYRLVSIDERGNKLTSEDRRVTPKRIEGATYIPGDRKSPPYRLDKPGAYYVLTADIDADVTGVDIVASNVVLDLNGHTIMYDRSKDAYEKVKDTEAFRTGFGPKPNDGPHGVRGSYASQKGGVRVLNGFIRQGEGGHSWWSAPITMPLGDEVAGVTMTYHGPQVYGTTAEIRNLHHNVFLDLGTKLPNRHQGNGAILIGRHAHHNLIKRSRHRGIDVPHGGKVYGNEIYIDSYATNAFGVSHYQTRNAQCNNNRIFGTGYHFIGIGTISEGVGDIKIDGNFIHGRTLDETDDRANEYGDQSGVNGLRVNWGGENIEWSNNVVVVEGRGAAKGEVRGVWHVPDRHQRGLVYHDNIFKAVADPQKETALGAVVISGGQNAKNDAPGLFRDNTIISDFANVSLGGLYYGDGNNARFERNTFVKLGERKDYRTIQVGSPGDRSSSGHLFIDSRFKEGAGYEHVHWRGAGDFSVGWTVSIKTVPKAQIKIRDKSGELVLSASTGDRGVVKPALVQYRHANAGKTLLTPHTVTVEKDSKKIAESTVTVDRTMDVTLMPNGAPAADADGAKDERPAERRKPEAVPDADQQTPREDNSVTDEMKRLEGSWRAVAIEVGGKELDRKAYAAARAERRIADQRLEFLGAECALVSGKRVTKGAFTIDPGQAPKWIDVTLPNRIRWAGIYELKNGVLKVFFNVTGETRPTEFKSKEGSQQVITTYDRVAAEG